jgi:hypothetical protein
MSHISVAIASFPSPWLLRFAFLAWWYVYWWFTDSDCGRTQKAPGVIGSSETSVTRRPPRLLERSHRFPVVLGRWPLQCFCQTHSSRLRGSTNLNNCRIRQKEVWSGVPNVWCRLQAKESSTASCAFLLDQKSATRALKKIIFWHRWDMYPARLETLYLYLW